MPPKYPQRTANTAARRRAARLYHTLTAIYPEADCALIYRNTWELLVATILSAQCTDVRVNMVTPALFKKCPTPQATAKAKISDLERMIKTTGFFRNKARNIRGAAITIIDEFDGVVPDQMDQLLSLPGVARKTANVVLGNAFGKNEGIVVDTHVGRISQRLGLTKQKDPKKIELDLIALFPRKNWTMLSHLLISHGRKICMARRPACAICAFRRSCPREGVELPQTA